jgi:hypothetical protein
VQKLICELCRSNDFTKDDQGFFVCDYCRTKYTPEQARSMIVEGTVRVDRSGEASSLLTLASTALSGGNMQEALDYANRALEIDPEDPTAWYLRGSAVGWLSTLESLRLREMLHAFEHAVRYAAETERAEVQKWCAQQAANAAVHFASPSWDEAAKRHQSVRSVRERNVARSEEILNTLATSYQWHPRPEPLEAYLRVVVRMPCAGPEHERIAQVRIDWATNQLEHVGGGYSALLRKPAHWPIDPRGYLNLALSFPQPFALILAEDQRRPLKGLNFTELKSMLLSLDYGLDFSTARKQARPWRRW